MDERDMTYGELLCERVDNENDFISKTALN